MVGGRNVSHDNAEGIGSLKLGVIMDRVAHYLDCGFKAFLYLVSKNILLHVFHHSESRSSESTCCRFTSQELSS